MLKKLLKNRVVQKGLLSLTGLWLVLGIVVAANIVGSMLFVRLDLTEERLYSLSKASIDLIRKLEEPVVIKAYFSKDLAPPYSTYESYVKDLLEEYVTYSKGKIKFSAASTEDEQKFAEDARRSGVMPVRFTQIARDKYEIREGYLGLVLRHEDQKEVIPWIKDTTGLEYDITSHIKKLAFPTDKTIGVVTSNGTLDVFSDIPGLSEITEKQYAIRRLDLSQPDFDNVSALLLIGPKETLTDVQRYHLDQALMRGIPTGVFVDLQTVDLSTFAAKKISPGLEEWLKAQGVTVKPGFVFDLQNQQITIQSRQGIFTVSNIVQYPAFPVCTKFDKDNPAVKEVEQATFPYVHPLEASTTSLKATLLCQSSPKSWYKETVFNLSPFIDFRPEAHEPKGPFTFMLVLEGKFQSQFAKPPEELTEAGDRLLESPETRLLVAGTSRLVDPELPVPQTNFAMFLNIVDYLAQDESLIAIRSKGSTFRPLKELSATQRTLTKYASMFTMPLVVVAAGLLGWRQRRKSTRNRAKEYQHGA